MGKLLESMQEWAIYLDGKEIDVVSYPTSMEAVNVRFDLTEYGGYNHRIHIRRVERNPKPFIRADDEGLTLFLPHGTPAGRVESALQELRELALATEAA